MTQEQFGIYRKFAGDGDAFARRAGQKEKHVMSGFDWGRFEVLLQDLYIVLSNNASSDFKAQVFDRLSQITNVEALQDDVIKYAGEVYLAISGKHLKR